MRQLAGSTICILMIGAQSGCRTEQLRRDQDQFRAALLQMETDQILDNLIRAKMGLPIVHVDYDKIGGTVTQVHTGELRGSYQDVVGGAVTRLMSGVWTTRQDNQLTVSGNPVRDKPEVYMAYLKYISLPDGLLVSPEAPPFGAAHLCKCVDSWYYWVPVNRRGEFFELSMRVSALRGQAVSAPEGFELTISNVRRIEPEPPEGQPAPMGSYRLEVEFQQPMERNDSGSANVSVDGVVYPLEFAFNDRVATGDPTPVLYATYVFGLDIEEGEIPVEPRILAERLKGQRIKFYSARFRPPAPTAEKLLRDIGDELNFIRLNQLRTQIGP